MKRIAIIGAKSYIGVSTERHLNSYPEHYHVDTIDVKEKDWEKVDFSKYDSVYHVAGIAHADIKKLSEEQKEMYYKVNTNLAIAVAAKVKECGVKQFIFMSTANVYGESTPIGKHNVITKDTPVKSVNVYSDSKLKAESGIAALEDNDFKVVILRCPMVYGTGCKGNYAALAKMAKKLPIFPKVKNERSMVYIENLTEFVRLMIENEEQGVFCPCDAEPFCTSEVVKQIAELHGKRIILVPGVTWILRILGIVFKSANKAFGNFVYEDALSVYKEEYRKYSLSEAIKRTEEANGEL